MKISDRFDKPSSVRRILVLQLGDIGDVVWSLPALQAVREAYPRAVISVLLREGSGSLIAAMTSPPRIFEVRKGKGGLGRRLRSSLRLVCELRRERFDLVFDFRGDERGAYTAFATGAPIRAALYLPGLPGLRNHLFNHLAAPTGPAPAVGAADSSLNLLHAFGIEARNVVPDLCISDEVIVRAEKILADEGVGRACEATCMDEGRTGTGPVRREGWVTLNPFSRWTYKEWAPEKWVRIIDWLGKDFGLTVVIVGAPSERVRANKLAVACSSKVYNLAGRTTLAELAGVLKQSRLHIGVDSAAPHIAAAVGTPTVTLYGPSDWRYWAPPGESNRVVVPDMACAPCHLKGCDGSGISRCLDTLPVERVQTIIREAIKKVLSAED